MTVQFSILGSSCIGHVHPKTVKSTAGARQVATTDLVCDAAKKVVYANCCGIRTIALSARMATTMAPPIERPWEFSEANAET